MEQRRMVADLVQQWPCGSFPIDEIFWQKCFWISIWVCRLQCIHELIRDLDGNGNCITAVAHQGLLAVGGVQFQCNLVWTCVIDPLTVLSRFPTYKKQSNVIESKNHQKQSNNDSELNASNQIELIKSKIIRFVLLDRNPRQGWNRYDVEMR